MRKYFQMVFPLVFHVASMFPLTKIFTEKQENHSVQLIDYGQRNVEIFNQHLIVDMDSEWFEMISNDL